jgi:tRNA threonylcarbamoyl adenosine modification protein YeaZ
MSDAAEAGHVLWIDTSGPWCCVAIVTQQTVVVERCMEIHRGHGEVLLSEIDAAIGAARLGLEEFAAIGVCTGPGGYAGLRVGIAVAQGLALATGKPLIGLPNSETLGSEEALPPLMAAEALWERRRHGTTGAKPIYPMPPDAAVSTHKAPPLLD